MRASWTCFCRSVTQTRIIWKENNTWILCLYMGVTEVQSTGPRYTGEFHQPLMLGLVSWVWLGMGKHAGVNNDREETLLSFTTVIEHHHHIISSLQLYTYRLTHLAYRLTTLCHKRHWFQLDSNVFPFHFGLNFDKIYNSKQSSTGFRCFLSKSQTRMRDQAKQARWSGDQLWSS